MKRLLIYGIAFIALLSLLNGCSAGRDFVRPDFNAFQLGQTTYSQVIQKLGEPRAVGEVLIKGEKVKRISYSYATKVGDPLEEGVIPTRQLVYFFYNDKLVSQAFLSSFKSDNSNFEDKKIGSILKGKTRRLEVIQLLGKPSASLIPPMAKESSGGAIGYGYATSRRDSFSAPKFFVKTLIITFDDKDIVSDIDYSTSGNK